MLSIIILIIIVILAYKATPPKKKDQLNTLTLFGVDYFTSYYHAGGLSLC